MYVGFPHLPYYSNVSSPLKNTTGMTLSLFLDTNGDRITVDKLTERMGSLVPIEPEMKKALLQR